MVLVVCLSTASPHHGLLIPENHHTGRDETWHFITLEKRCCLKWRLECCLLHQIFNFLRSNRFWSPKTEWKVSKGILLFSLLPSFFFKSSCWAIDFLWLAHLVLIIARFLPGISRKQLSDKFLFRWCYLATASCPITNSLLVQQLNSLKLFHCCRKIHKTSTSQTVFSMKNKTSLLGCLAFQLETFGSTRFI